MTATEPDVAPEDEADKGCHLGSSTGGADCEGVGSGMLEEGSRFRDSGPTRGEEGLDVEGNEDVFTTPMVMCERGGLGV